MTAISGAAVKQLIKGALLKENVDQQVAEYVAEGLTSTSLRGVDSHGVRLIHHYIAGVKSGRINPKPKFTVEKKMPTAAVLDADDTFGHAACMEAAKIAVEMAAEYGSGHVAVKNSTHFGAAAYYAIEIANQDMVGMSFTHSDSLIIPTHGKRSFLGNNPVCFAAPVKNAPPFCLDMATSITTFNEIRRLRETGESAPEGVGVDSEGRLTTDPNKITMLTPVGGYKGYGLSLMVEILCSMMTGMNFGPHISKMFEKLENKRHLGQFVSAINISAFQEIEVFKERMSQLMNELRNEPPLEPGQSVMVADDPQKINFAKRSKEGIPVTEAEFAQFKGLNEEYKLNVELGA